MDGSRFDNLTRSLAISRRGVLKQLAAVMLSGAGGLVGVRVAGAQACADLRRRCTTDGDCCSGLCDPASGRCACPADTDECGGACLPLDQYESDTENCGGCRVRCRRAPECQMPACTAGVCGTLPDPAQLEQPCGPFSGGVYGVCNAEGLCVCPSHLPTQCGRGCVDTLTDPDNCGACDVRCSGTAHGSAICEAGVCGIACDAGYLLCGGGCCPDSRNCCDGVCCGPGECCGNGACSAEACAPHCVIDGIWIADGTINSANECEICDRDRNETDWSTAASGTLCGEPGQCCNLGICQDCGCQIGGAPVATGSLNPDNPCEICDPVADALAWTPLTGDDCGSFQTCCEGICCPATDCCGENFTCEPCRCVIDGLHYEDGEVNPGHDCEFCDPASSTDSWNLLTDFTQCGGTPGRICCNGQCCSPTECCTPTGCEECGPVCRIDDQDVLAFETHPDDPCQVCNPDIRIYDWSDAPDNFSCSSDLDEDRVCCRGLCCDPGECCDDGCKPCRCQIAGFPWDAGARNPLNHCEVCDPARDPENWSPAINGSGCGDGDARECCEGQCCAAGDCCNDIGECEPCPCRINGQDVLNGVANPQNTCQVCDTSRSLDDWTTLDDGAACGTDADDRVCCAGACCSQGQCCMEGTCQDCGCEIDGEPVSPGTINLDNTCQICDPQRARLAWSPVENGTACGASGDQRCCGGDCCATDDCCILEVCGTCLCQVDGINHPAETPNPDNPCEVCDPEADPFGWSTAADRTSCGEGQVCCTGSCCDPGLCCVLGICQFCGCQIGEELIPEFTINDANECEWCDPVLNAFGWTPRSDEPCGDGGNQVCCNGACCGSGYCCDLGDTCLPCPCEIGGVVYPSGTSNPANPCEVCDSLRNQEGWSFAPGNATCGATNDQFCCAGSCCPDGECCHTLDGACGAEPCHCTIGETEVPEGEPNSQNECEHCDPAEDSSNWSPRTDDSPCGPTGSQVCCAGTCCAEGNCCTLGVCGFCGCQIGGQLRAEGAVNPDNPCQWCDPVLDQFAWSPVADDTSCGAGQVCCNGICCGPEQCCGLTGSCGLCEPGCSIGGVTYPVGTTNPNNACQVCDPSASAIEWTDLPDGAVCGEFEDQVCCGGACCRRGWCCIEGVCDIERCQDPCVIDPDSCQCFIDGIVYPNGAINPVNECQFCSWYASPTTWSMVSNNTPCGPAGAQYCCQGTCCGDGECCTSGGACETGGSTVCNGCDINGHFYPIATVNPANECEFCAPAKSTTSWSPRDNHVTCGDGNERNCCNGLCCATGLCCTSTSVGGTCEPCGCDIDGGSYVAGQLNPANWCLVCDPDVSSTAWSISDVQFCEFDFSRDCCNGICCTPGTCCGFSGVCEPMEPDVSNCVNWQI